MKRNEQRQQSIPPEIGAQSANAHANMKEAASGQLHRQLQKMPDATAALNDRPTILVEQTSSIDLSGRGTQPTPSTLAAKSEVAWAVFIRRAYEGHCMLH